MKIIGKIIAALRGAPAAPKPAHGLPDGWTTSAKQYPAALLTNPYLKHLRTTQATHLQTPLSPDGTKFRLKGPREEFRAAYMLIMDIRTRKGR